jgi:predicted GH43/DUF377 family glycosyl hydrolase
VTGAPLVRRVPLVLLPDPARVVNQLFVAGEEVTTGASRATTVMRRALDLSDGEVDVVLASVLERFSDRHVDLESDLLVHFDQIGDRIGTAGLTRERRLLLGAFATSEYAVEAAALCNPSIVEHPDQSGLGAGQIRFVLSLRAIGEGHRSSIEFRTGIAGADGTLSVDPPGPLTSVGQLQPARYDRSAFAALFADRNAEVASHVLGRLGEQFSRPELDESLAGVQPHVLRRPVARKVIDDIRAAADSNYTLSFAPGTTLDQRVLRPHGPSESNGMEDARMVRFTDDDGARRYWATYTAFDGSRVAPQVITTVDFATFTVSQLTGRAAVNKGMAIFPRRINGRYAALSRWDRERNAVATSADGRVWDDVAEVQAPEQPWELVQVGNCGSPIETPDGWLVLTHGVGPMRTYCLGAMLLDLDEPTTVRGKLTVPLLEPVGAEREGYVPNVVYSCGALRHGDTLILPYACGDQRTTFALVDLPGLLERLLAP